jgi:mitotic-spindle organizing protein 1
MASLLRIYLDPEILSICCQLLEEGANPEALAALVAELQRETMAIKNQ